MTENKMNIQSEKIIKNLISKPNLNIKNLEMKFTEKLSLKFYRLRHKKWSAPAVFSFFIGICMLFIYIFESFGLLRKEKNLEYRLHTVNFGKLKIF